MPLSKVPNLTGTIGDPLKSVLRNTAEKTPLTEHQVAMAMSFFLEELANHVTRGELVRIPGFGMFGVNRAKLTCPTHLPHLYVAFTPARPFKRQLQVECPNDAPGIDACRKKNHHSGSLANCVETPGRARQRVFTAMHAFRVRLLNLAGREGGNLEEWKNTPKPPRVDGMDRKPCGFKRKTVKA